MGDASFVPHSESHGETSKEPESPHETAPRGGRTSPRRRQGGRQFGTTPWALHVALPKWQRRTRPGGSDVRRTILHFAAQENDIAAPARPRGAAPDLTALTAPLGSNDASREGHEPSLVPLEMLL